MKPCGRQILVENRRNRMLPGFHAKTVADRRGVFIIQRRSGPSSEVAWERDAYSESRGFSHVWAVLYRIAYWIISKNRVSPDQNSRYCRDDVFFVYDVLLLRPELFLFLSGIIHVNNP